jgi:hypothetical protein
MKEDWDVYEWIGVVCAALLAAMYVLLYYDLM